MGHGAFKDVFRCEFDDEGKFVAVAKIRGITKKDQFTKQHLRELKTFAVSAGHPNVVQLEGLTKEGWLVMEYCPSKLKTIQPKLVTFDAKMSFALGICRGLSFLHPLGIVHGDLKPDNVLVSADDSVAKLSDFGFSYDVNSSSVSLRVQIGGTVPYQAPELALSQKARASIDPRFKDIYALGGVLLFLFCGEEPWTGESEEFIRENRTENRNSKTDFLPEDQIQKLLEESKENREDVENICKIIKRCFSTDPLQRGTSRQIMSELEAIMDKVPSPVAFRKEESLKKLEAAFLEEFFRKAEALQSENSDIKSMLSMIITMMQVQQA